MIVTRITLVLGVAVYLLLWALEIHGASSLLPFLVIPLVLAILVGGGNWLSQYIGLPERKVKFEDPTDKDSQDHSA
jgi:hypothetical protein